MQGMKSFRKVHSESKLNKEFVAPPFTGGDEEIVGSKCRRYTIKGEKHAYL